MKYIQASLVFSMLIPASVDLPCLRPGQAVYLNGYGLLLEVDGDSIKVSKAPGFTGLNKLIWKQKEYIIDDVFFEKNSNELKRLDAKKLAFKNDKYLSVCGSNHELDGSFNILPHPISLGNGIVGIVEFYGKGYHDSFYRLFFWSKNTKKIVWFDLVGKVGRGSFWVLNG